MQCLVPGFIYSFKTLSVLIQTCEQIFFTVLFKPIVYFSWIFCLFYTTAVLHCCSLFTIKAEDTWQIVQYLTWRKFLMIPRTFLWNSCLAWLSLNSSPITSQKIKKGTKNCFLHPLDIKTLYSTNLNYWSIQLFNNNKL